MQTLSAPGLALEPLTVAHADAMFEVLSEQRLHEYLDYGPPASAEHLRGVYSKLERRASPDGSEQWLNWVVCLGCTEPIGVVQATIFAPGTSWIAYVFASKHWGKGFAQASTKVMLEHLASRYRINTFLATVEVENARSIALLERLSFRRATSQEAQAHQLTKTELLFVWP